MSSNKSKVEDELVKAGAGVVSEVIWSTMPESLKERFRKSPVMARSILAARFFPFVRNYDALGEFFSDLGRELQMKAEASAKGEQKAEKKVEEKLGGIKDWLTAYAQLGVALQGADQGQSDAFTLWLKALEDAESIAFGKFIATMTEEQLKLFVRLDLGTVDRLFQEYYDALKTIEGVSYLQLRGKVKDDALLAAKVDTALQGFSDDEQTIFWQGVQRDMENDRVSTLEDFTNLLALSKGELLARYNRSSFWEQAKVFTDQFRGRAEAQDPAGIVPDPAAVTGITVPSARRSAASGFRKRAEAWRKKQQDKNKRS